jgi:hypothetical protein
METFLAAVVVSKLAGPTPKVEVSWRLDLLLSFSS